MIFEKINKIKGLLSFFEALKISEKVIHTQ